MKQGYFWHLVFLYIYFSRYFVINVYTNVSYSEHPFRWCERFWIGVCTACVPPPGGGTVKPVNIFVR